MLKKYTIYIKSTGNIVGNVGTDDFLLDKTLVNFANMHGQEVDYIEGNYEHLTFFAPVHLLPHRCINGSIHLHLMFGKMKLCQIILLYLLDGII